MEILVNQGPAFFEDYLKKHPDEVITITLKLYRTSIAGKTTEYAVPEIYEAWKEKYCKCLSDCKCSGYRVLVFSQTDCILRMAKKYPNLKIIKN